MNHRRNVGALLVLIAALASGVAVADVKRHEFVPQALRGAWAPSLDLCKNGDKSVVVISAKSYVSSDSTCTIAWLSETAGARGVIYSAHMLCPRRQPDVQTTEANMILIPQNSDQISMGASFSTLREFRRCSTN